MCWPESSFLLDEMSSCNVETVPVLSFCNNFIPVMCCLLAPSISEFMLKELKMKGDGCCGCPGL